MEARAVADLEECFSTGVRVAVKAGGDFGERIDVIVAARAGVGFEERFFFFFTDVNAVSRAGDELDEWVLCGCQCGFKGGWRP